MAYYQHFFSDKVIRWFISNHAKTHAISVMSPLLITIIQQCFIKKMIDTTKSQLRVLASHKPIWAPVDQGTLELSLPRFGRCNIWVTLAFLDDLLRKGAYRDISHIILAHTISNKLLSKVSAQKKGGKVMTTTNYAFKFRMFQVEFPLVWGDDTWNHWNLNTYLSCHNFSPLSSVQILLILACCLLYVL